MPDARVINDDALDALKEIPDASIDSVVTDPPYELGFMGKTWDASGIAYNVDLWREVLRVLKPGGYLLAFGGTRTVHRITCAIEDAGFEIRDGIDWLYAKGFPKSLDVSKAIDKAARAGGDRNVTAPATDDARRWVGWGTALKPAREPITVARKPLTVKTVAANVQQFGTGALNIAACRVDSGRWPSNVVLSHAPDCAETCLPGCPAAALDAQSGNVKAGGSIKGYHAASGRGGGGIMGEPAARYTDYASYGDSGGASRFFPVFRYQSKAPTRERPKVDGIAHPTVKPLALMQWLVKLVTPPNGTVLDLFAGSGTTVEACLLEGFNCIAVENEESYMPLIDVRINRANATNNPTNL